MKPELNNEAKKQIKEILKYLKLARSADHITYHALVSGEKLKEAVLKPLEELVGWNEEDEKKIKKLAGKLKEETQGQTAAERSDKLHKILKIGGGIAAGAGIIAGIARLLKKNNGNGEE